MPAYSRLPPPRYAEVSTSTSCPAERRCFSSSTNQGTITSSGERGNAVSTWRMRIGAVLYYVTRRLTTRMKRLLRAAGQVIVLGGALWFLVRTAQPHWSTLTSLPQPIAWTPLLLGSLLWVGSYAVLVLLWAESLRWWGARLAPFDALRVFLVANLARYVPGGIWQFAGLAALALEQGISPAAATGAVLVQQLVLL